VKMTAEEKPLQLQPLRRFLQKGAGEKMRISADAMEALRELMQNLLVRLGALAARIAKENKRKTIKKADVEQAFSEYFMCVKE